MCLEFGGLIGCMLTHVYLSPIGFNVTAEALKWMIALRGGGRVKFIANYPDDFLFWKPNFRFPCTITRLRTTNLYSLQSKLFALRLLLSYWDSS